MGISNAYYNQYGPAAISAANAAGVDPAIFQSLIMSESSFNPYAFNPSGAAGMGQIMPSTAAKYGVSNVYDPTANLNASANILADFLKQNNGDYSAAIAGYKGYSDVNSPAAQAMAQKVLGNASQYPGGDPANLIPGQSAGMLAQNASNQAAANNPSNKSLWQWDLSDWKNFIANSAMGVIITLIGVVLVLGSAWVLISKQNITLPTKGILPS